MVGLGDLAGGIFSSTVRGISGDGSLLVGESHTALGAEAFVWDATNGMRNLRTALVSDGVDMTGWTLTHALGASADNKFIVGYGINPDGNNEAWIAQLNDSDQVVPEPTTFAIWSVIGGIGFLASRRRRPKTGVAQGFHQAAHG